jgi:hypothetical protein
MHASEILTGATNSKISVMYRLAQTMRLGKMKGRSNA